MKQLTAKTQSPTTTMSRTSILIWRKALCPRRNRICGTERATLAFAPLIVFSESRSLYFGSSMWLKSASCGNRRPLWRLSTANPLLFCFRPSQLVEPELFTIVISRWLNSLQSLSRKQRAAPMEKSAWMDADSAWRNSTATDGNSGFPPQATVTCIAPK